MYKLDIYKKKNNNNKEKKFNHNHLGFYFKFILCLSSLKHFEFEFSVRCIHERDFVFQRFVMILQFVRANKLKCDKN